MPPFVPRTDVPLPRRMQGLPRDDRGFIVPWFVDWRDGKPVFPAFDPVKLRRATKPGDRRCWVCGEKLGRHLTFVIGPMCVINRVTSEPPCHADCAEYSARVCPFLANPRMGRVPLDKISGGEIMEPGGMMDPGNPGVMVLWTTDDYRIIRTPTGPLLNFSDPTAVSWWTQGRQATAQEASTGFTIGAAKLLKIAEREGEAAVTEFLRLCGQAGQSLPDREAAA